MLPSEALDKATTFDLRAMEVSNRYQARKATMKDGKNPKPTALPSQKEMQAMLDRVRNDPKLNSKKPGKRGKERKT